MARSRLRLLPVAVLLLSTNQAGAVDERVKSACRDDYFQFCSGHEVGSEALRQCMRKADSKLSPICVDALVAAGEVTADEIKRRRAATAR